MKTTKAPATELLIVTERASFLAEARQALGQLEGVGIASVEAAPRPSGLTGCLSALEFHPGGILLIDGQEDAGAALLLTQEIFDRQAAARVFLAGSGSDADLILRAQRTGVSEFLPLPLDRRTVSEAIQRLWRRNAPEGIAGARKRGRIFPFVGTKGGCGTTTLATSLAVTLATQGRSTLLVDLDVSAGDISLMLNLSAAFTVRDVVQNSHRLDRELLSGMVARHVSGLEVLASGENSERLAELEPAKIAHILGFLREHFECVVVNTRGMEDSLAQAAVGQADLVHLVSCLDFLALRRAQWALRRLIQSGLSPERIRLVVNRFDRNPYITLDEAETALEMKVAWTVPLDAKTAQEALNDGVPLVSRSRNGLLSCFESYAAGLFPGDPAIAAAGSRRGLFGLLPSRAVPRPREGGAVA